MIIDIKKNYTISKPEVGQKITGTEIIMDSYYCEDDRGLNCIKAVKLYPEREDNNQYFLEYYHNPTKWAIKWFIDYLKTQNLTIVI